MHIIVSHEDVVMDWAENLTYLENGNPCVNGVLAYDKSMVKSVLVVDSVPIDIERDKYKYTLSNGFVNNENWLDPASVVDPKILEEKIQKLESELALAKEDSVSNMLAITEVYELLLANNGGTA